MDANHFRKRAARAREMAKSGEDPRLAEMLLEVAQDLDAEAALIDAESANENVQPNGNGAYAKLTGTNLTGSLLWPADTGRPSMPVRIVTLSRGGAKLHTEMTCQPGTDVILDLPRQGLRLAGRITRAAGLEACMVFEPASVQDPGFTHYLRSGSGAETVQAANAC